MAKARRGVRLSFDANEYTPVNLKYEYSYQELHDEYRRLYKAARQRLRRLESAGYGTSNIYKYNVQALKSISEYPNTGAGKHGLAHALTDVVNFLESPASTVSGQRELWERTSATLKKRGYDIDVEDMESYGKWWDFMRTLMDKENIKRYDSDRIVKLWKANERLKVPKGVLRERYMEFLANVDELEQMPKYTKASGMSRTEYWNTLELGQ